MAKNQKETVRVPDIRKAKSATENWLERSNPLAGLSIRSAQSIFDAARSGNTQRLHWVFQEIEAANPLLFTCVDRRQSAIVGFSWGISARPSADAGLAGQQKDAAEKFVSDIENFTEMLEHLDEAFFRGFSLSQPIWEADGTVKHIENHKSWEFLSYDGMLYHNPWCDGFNSAHCVPCDKAGLIGVWRARSVDYPALSIHIRDAVSERYWGQFLERYALPKPAVTMAPNATNAQRDDYILAARCVENGQISVWPSGSSITDFAGGSRGMDPFNSFIEHQEKLIVLLATGGMLTSLAQADTGSLAGGAHMKVWQEIVRRDAGVLSQAVMRSLIKPYLARIFPGAPICVDFSLDFPERATAQEAASVAATLRQAGWRVDQAELEKAVGFSLERDDSQPGGGVPGLGFARAAAKEPQNAPEGLLKLLKPHGAGLDGKVDAVGVHELADAFLKGMAEAIAKEIGHE